jgi:hypothetical protein
MRLPELLRRPILTSLRLAALLSLSCLVVLPQSAAAQDAPTPAAAAPAELPGSLSRIREALKKPEPRLVSPLVKADFTVGIAEQQRFQDLVDLLDFSASPVLPAVRFGGSQTQPLVNVSLSGIGQSVVNSVSKARRERAERLARAEVERALDQFCASHECAAR